MLHDLLTRCCSAHSPGGGPSRSPSPQLLLGLGPPAPQHPTAALLPYIYTVVSAWPQALLAPAPAGAAPAAADAARAGGGADAAAPAEEVAGVWDPVGATLCAAVAQCCLHAIAATLPPAEQQGAGVGGPAAEATAPTPHQQQQQHLATGGRLSSRASGTSASLCSSLTTAGGGGGGGGGGAAASLGAQASSRLTSHTSSSLLLRMVAGSDVDAATAAHLAQGVLRVLSTLPPLPAVAGPAAGSCGGGGAAAPGQACAHGKTLPGCLGCCAREWAALLRRAGGRAWQLGSGGGGGAAACTALWAPAAALLLAVLRAALVDGRPADGRARAALEAQAWQALQVVCQHAPFEVAGPGLLRVLAGWAATPPGASAAGAPFDEGRALAARLVAVACEAYVPVGLPGRGGPGAARAAIGWHLPAAGVLARVQLCEALAAVLRLALAAGGAGLLHAAAQHAAAALLCCAWPLLPCLPSAAAGRKRKGGPGGGSEEEDEEEDEEGDREQDESGLDVQLQPALSTLKDWSVAAAARATELPAWVAKALLQLVQQDS